MQSLAFCYKWCTRTLFAQAACHPARCSSIKSDNKLLLLNDSEHDESSVSDCCSDSYGEDSSNLTSSARPVRREDSFKLNQQTLHASVSKWQRDVPENGLNFKTQKSCEVTSVKRSQPVHVHQPNQHVLLYTTGHMEKTEAHGLMLVCLRTGLLETAFALLLSFISSLPVGGVYFIMFFSMLIPGIMMHGRPAFIYSPQSALI